MKSTKFLTWILAILGFQMQSCGDGEEIGGREEYGCPYTKFRTHGTVKDETGNAIQDAEVKVNIDAIVRIEGNDSTGAKDTVVWNANQTSNSDKNGNYSIDNEAPGIVKHSTYRYEVIASKDGYTPDTMYNDVKEEDLKYESEGSWGGICKEKINLILKKK